MDPVNVDEAWVLANTALLLGGDAGVPGQDESYLRGHAARLAYSATLVGRHLKPNQRVLDIGGGVGYIGTIIQHTQSTPFEYHLYEAEGVRSDRYLVTNHDFDGERLRAADGSYDLVVLLEVIEHLIKDPYLLVTEINRILAPEGLLIISTPNVSSVAAAVSAMRGRSPVWNPIRPNLYARHNKEYTVPELRSLATHGGYDVVHEEAPTQILPWYQQVFAALLAFTRVSPLPRRLLGPQYYGVWRKARSPSPTPPWDIYYKDDYDSAPPASSAGSSLQTANTL